MRSLIKINYTKLLKIETLNVATVIYYKSFFSINKKFLNKIVNLMRSVLRLFRSLEKKNAFPTTVIFYSNKKKKERKKSERSKLRVRVTLCKLTHF